VPAMAQSPFDMSSMGDSPFSPFSMSPYDMSSGGTPQASGGIGQSQMPTDVTPTGINAGAQDSASRYEAMYRRAVVSNSLTFQKKMNSGRVAFGRQMENQYFNTKYWEPVYLSGVQYWKLKDGASKVEALEDFISSGGGKYKIDCAAAINLILLKSKLDVVGEQNFNKHLPALIIRGWKTITVKDGNVEEYKTLEKWSGNEYMPGTVDGLKTGDYVYFKNHPMMEGTPEQGENAIYLGKDSWGKPVFFGLNIGIFRGLFHQYGILSSERGSVDPQVLKKMAES
jgi:protein-glutamine gamma-glutamyltransferase